MLVVSCIWGTRAVPSDKTTDLKCELQMWQARKKTWKRQQCCKPIPQEQNDLTELTHIAEKTKSQLVSQGCVSVPAQP